MDIVHELGQLDFGGVERVIRNIIKFDKKNKHHIVALKDGPFRKELEAVGANVIIPEKDVPIDCEGDLVHVHSGGAVSNMALNLGHHLPVIETIHSPLRSPMRDDVIFQRVGVTEAVSKKNSNCVTILNGIDLENSVPTRGSDDIRSELGIPVDALVIGRLGRIGPDKGLEDWLMTCYRLQQEGLDFVPLIVGGEARGFNGSYVGRLKLMAESLPVKNIIWVGHKDDVANYFQVMDIFLYPSPTEGFGLVFIEAMFNDCTIVTYENDVTWELLAGHAILTKNSIDGLVQGVKKAFNPDLRDAYVSIGADFVADHFSAEKMSEEYQELYERCHRDFNRKG